MALALLLLAGEAMAFGKEKGREAMGGPWRDPRFDPSTWRTPVAARGPARAEISGSGVPDPLTGIVVGYDGAALTSVGMLLILLRNGW